MQSHETSQPMCLQVFLQIESLSISARGASLGFPFQRHGRAAVSGGLCQDGFLGFPVTTKPVLSVSLYFFG